MLVDIGGIGIEWDTVVGYNLNDEKDINGIPTVVVHTVLDRGKHRDIRFEGQSGDIFRAVVMHFQTTGDIMTGELIHAKIQQAVENTMRLLQENQRGLGTIPNKSGRNNVVPINQKSLVPGKPVPDVNELLRQSFGTIPFPVNPSPTTQSEGVEGTPDTLPPFPPA
jgi:hypothetical protein